MAYFKLILFTFLALSPCFALAGTSIGGGGTSCGGQFLDNMYRKGKYKPKDDPAFEQVVKPAIDRIRKCLPFFADDLEMVLSKPWYKVDCRLKVANEGTSHYAAEQMAYQDRVGIFLDENLIKDADDENRGDMILHELIQGIRIERNMMNLPGEPEVEDSAVGVLNDKLLEDDYTTCPGMQEGVRKFLLTTYATQPQLDKWGVKSLEKKKNEVRTACTAGYAPDLLNASWSPLKHFQDLHAGDPYIGWYSGSHFLHVANDEKSLKQDAEVRIKAKIHVLYDGEGFYTIPLTLKSVYQLCDELGTPFAVPNAASSTMSPKPPIPTHFVPDPDPLSDKPANKPGSAPAR
ncbi:MAG: hypothetical protein ACXVB9_01755 [Bdellovibrionota bacterium]